MSKEIVLYIDGAARGNPGPAGIGAVIKDRDTPVIQLSEYIGEATNNVAEYSALLMALQKAREVGARVLDIRSDSELLVRQLSGTYKVKNEGLKPFYSRVTELLSEFERVRFEHIPREQNTLADSLANRAIDEFFAGKRGIASLKGVANQDTLF